MQCHESHGHGASTTCHYVHGCKCDGCGAVRTPSRLELALPGVKLTVMELCRWVDGVAETVTGSPVAHSRTHYRLQRDREVHEYPRTEWVEVTA